MAVICISDLSAGAHSAASPAPVVVASIDPTRWHAGEENVVSNTELQAEDLAFFNTENGALALYRHSDSIFASINQSEREGWQEFTLLNDLESVTSCRACQAGKDILVAISAINSQTLLILSPENDNRAIQRWKVDRRSLDVPGQVLGMEVMERELLVLSQVTESRCEVWSANMLDLKCQRVASTPIATVIAGRGKTAISAIPRLFKLSQGIGVVGVDLVGEVVFYSIGSGHSTKILVRTSKSMCRACFVAGIAGGLNAVHIVWHEQSDDGKWCVMHGGLDLTIGSVKVTSVSEHEFDQIESVTQDRTSLKFIGGRLVVLWTRKSRGANELVVSEAAAK